MFSGEEIQERVDLIEAIIERTDEEELRACTTEYLRSVYAALYPEVD